MKTKKTERANLENKRTLFFQIGLLISMALALIVFEWSSKGHQGPIIQEMGLSQYLDEDVMNTFMEEKPKEVIPPPAPQPLIFTIKENTMDIEPADIDWSSETTQGEMIGLQIYQPEEPVTDEVFVFVEDMPKFGEGGLEDFAKYVYQNLKYPQEAIEYGIHGRVSLGFVIDKDGTIKDVTVQRSAHPLLDKEVIRVVKNAPDWTPGKQRGKPVKVGFVLPIVFKLQS